MDTMKKKPFAVMVGQSELLNVAVQQIAFKAGLEWFSSEGEVLPIQDTSDSEYTIDFDRSLAYADRDWFITNGYEVLDARTQMGEIIDRLENKTIEVQLNDDYRALVSEDLKTVKVGCQTFEVSKIQQLIDAINEAK